MNYSLTSKDTIILDYSGVMHNHGLILYRITMFPFLVPLSTTATIKLVKAKAGQSIYPYFFLRIILLGYKFDTSASMSKHPY